MPVALRFRSALLRSAALFAASAVAGPVFGQAFPPGAISAPAGMTAGDPFAGGAYAVPTAGPVAVAYGDPATLSGGTVISGPAVSAPAAGGTQTFMAPQVIGSPQMMGGQMMGAPMMGAPMMGSPMPGSPGCNCGPGGGSAPMFDGSMMGMPMGTPSYGAPMTGPSYGAMPGACGDGCCTTGGSICDPCGVAPMCDPCGGVPICDPCQSVPPVFGSQDRGLYHSMGGKPRCGWSTGFTWVFLKPYYSSNEAFATTSGGTTTITDFGHSFDLSPRVFVEWVSPSDWGIRATWFGFENDSDSETTVVPNPGFGSTALNQFANAGDTITAQSTFDVDTIDLDATQRIQAGKSLVNLGGGIRWMGYEHQYKSAITGGFPSTGEASRQFDGVGPTVFAEWRRPIGSSRFSLLAQVRGSLLYGQSEFDATRTFNGVPSDTIRTEADDFVGTAETQLGGEWSAWIGERTVLFVQLAYEAQAIMGVGTALDANDDLGLHGFNTKVGFEW